MARNKQMCFKLLLLCLTYSVGKETFKADTFHKEGQKTNSIVGFSNREYDVAEESEMTEVLRTARPKFADGPRKCPCSNRSLCERIKSKPPVESFVFSLKKENWKKYDWDKITTIVEFTYHDDELMCYAHSRGVRIVAAAPQINSRATLDPRRRSEWVNSTVSRVLYNFLDGINVDHEAYFSKEATAYRDSLTSMMKELNQSMEAVLPGIQVTMDIPRTLNGYDIKAISETLDFFFIMSYHKPRTAYAGATAPIDDTIRGIEEYLDLGVPSHQLLLGVPWYGFLFHCLSFNQTAERCRKYHIRPTNQNYDDVITKLLPKSFVGRLWDDVAKSPFGDVKNQTSGVISQFWYDDAVSLRLRKELAWLLSLRGVGMWHADTLNYANSTETREIWGTLPKRA